MFTIVGLALALTIAQAPAPGVQPPADALALQVALDRAGFSPGIIDGQMGSNTERAVSAYREQRGGDPQPAAKPLTAYTITAEDISGPFERIPADMMEKARLPSLTYTSPLEALAERYHSAPQLIRRLNPEAKFTAGEQIQVPNVEPFIVPAPRMISAPKEARAETGTTGRGARGRAATPPVNDDLAAKPDVVVTVSKSSSTLTVVDADKRVVMFAPVTTGSEHDPLPVGEWKVTGIQFSPQFRYNPDLFWDADPAHTKALLKPGPNNPVGVVWIDLSKKHYGIHGTPEPAAIGKTTSHGCVRLTNWDAMRLAGLVKPGTRVVFSE
jgi:lipoprotein-anchoring transpeptidase ErfK/SrfK